MDNRFNARCGVCGATRPALYGCGCSILKVDIGACEASAPGLCEECNDKVAWQTTPEWIAPCECETDEHGERACTDCNGVGFLIWDSKRPFVGPTPMKRAEPTNALSMTFWSRELAVLVEGAEDDGPWTGTLDEFCAANPDLAEGPELWALEVGDFVTLGGGAGLGCRIVRTPDHYFGLPDYTSESWKRTLALVSELIGGAP